MNNLIRNGDFSQLGEHWSYDSQRVRFFDGVAAVTQVGYIEQQISLPSTLKAGTAVSITFKLSNVYGSVGVRLNTVSYPDIEEAGDHVIAIVTKTDADVLTLHFQAGNAFNLDNVTLELPDAGCIPTDVIQNGEFDGTGEPWSYDPQKVYIRNGVAEVTQVSGIEQKVTLPSIVPAGTPIPVKFKLAQLYGALTVSIDGAVYPYIRDNGDYEISIVTKVDASELTLRFQASNAFHLDKVSMMICLPS